MKMKKAPAWLVARFAEVLPSDPRVEPKKMFGMPAAFTRGNMFAGLFEDLLLVRLDEAQRAEVRRAGGAPFAPMGREMREYVTLPPAVVEHDLDGTRRWVARAFTFVSS